MSGWNLPDIWDRLKHDLTFRVGTLYAGASWFLVEALDTLQMQPSLIRRMALVLALGFIPVASAAWLWQRRSRNAAPAANVGGTNDEKGDVAQHPKRATPTRRGYRRWAVGLTSFLVVALGLWAFGTRVSGDVPAAAERIAVLPFHATGSAEVRELGVGIVDLLTAALSDVGPIRTVASRTVLARITNDGETLSMEDARALARDIGAGSVLTGSITSFQGQANLAAELRDVRTGVVMAAAEVRGPQADMMLLTDRLAVGLLRELWRSKNPLPTIRTAGLTTESPAALRAWLRGEEHLRATRYDSAVAAFQQAVDQDSTFALAWFRLAEANGWALAQDGRLEQQRELLERALSLADRLPPREQSLVRGYTLRLRGDFAAFDTLEAYTGRYPDDPMGWYQLGDARYHSEYLGRYDTDQIVEPFLEATRLDPTFGTGLTHVLDAAIAFGDRQLFEETLPLFERFGAPDRVAQFRRTGRVRWAAPDSILPAFASEIRGMRVPAERTAILNLFGQIGARARTEVQLDPAVYLAAADTLAAVFPDDRVMVAAVNARRSWFHGAARNVSQALGDIDRWAETADLPPELPRPLFRSMQRAGMLLQERADTDLMTADVAVLREWSDRVPDFTLGLLLQHAIAVGNADDARRYERLLQELPLPPHWRRVDVDAINGAFGGWVDIMLGDTVGGLAKMEAGVRTLGFEDANYAGLPWEEYGAFLVRIPGREAQGVRMLQHYVRVAAPGTSRAYMHMAHGLERLGRTADAVTAYQHALRFLRYGDASAAALRAQAEQSLTRLSGERTP